MQVVLSRCTIIIISYDVSICASSGQHRYHLTLTPCPKSRTWVWYTLAIRLSHGEFSQGNCPLTLAQVATQESRQTCSGAIQRWEEFRVGE